MQRRGILHPDRGVSNMTPIYQGAHDTGGTAKLLVPVSLCEVDASQAATVGLPHQSRRRQAASSMHISNNKLRLQV